MDAWNGMTRRQQIWLLDRQMEGVDRAVADTIATTPQPKPSDSQARRIIETRAGLAPFSLSAVRVATRLLEVEVAASIERSMDYAASSMHPNDALPAHETLPHPDLGGLRLWEGEQPEDEGTIPTTQVGPILKTAFSLPGRDRLLISRASGIEHTTLSRMTTGNCRGITKSNLRILAHVLGLSPRVLGLEGGGNVDHQVARPDLRLDEKSAGRFDSVTTRMSIVEKAYPENVVGQEATMNDDVLELTEAIGDPNASEHDDDRPPSEAIDPKIEKGHVRSVSYEEVMGRAAGVSYVVHPEGGSTLHVVGRLTTSKIRSIAAILDLAIEGSLPEDDEAAVADIAFEGDDLTASKAYAELIAPRRKVRRRSLLEVFGL